MKKRIIVLFLAGLCAASLITGCGKKDSKGKENTTEESGNAGDAKSIEYDASEYVTLGEYKGMEVTVDSYKVEDADVKSYVEKKLNSTPSYTNTDKTTVENGDFVNIDYEGLLDGVAFDRGSAQDQVLEIGSKTFIEGFEEGLIGANVGESKALNLTFPEGYQNAEMAGKEVVFNVKVNAIVEKQVMAYDSMSDTYVSENFGYDTVQAYLDSVRTELETSNAYYEESDKRSAAVIKLKEICSVDKMPEGLLDARVKEYKDQFIEMCKEQNDMELAEYLEQNYQMTEEEFDTQTVDYMRDNLELELILQAISEKEKLEVDEEGFQKYLDNMMSNYSYENEQAIYDQYGEEYVKTSYLCNKALEFVLENIKVTYNEEKAEDENADADTDNTDAADNADGGEADSGE